MRLFRLLLLSLWACSFSVRAEMPDHLTFPAEGARLLLWVASERGLAEPEVHAAQQLAVQSVETWSLDLVGAYFLPQLASSMDAVPPQDVGDDAHGTRPGGSESAGHRAQGFVHPAHGPVGQVRVEEPHRRCRDTRGLLTA